MRDDTDEHWHEGTHKEALRCRSLCSLGVGVHHPPRVYQPEGPSNPYKWDFMEAFSRKHGQLLTPLQAFSPLPPPLSPHSSPLTSSPLWRMGAGAENSRLLVTACPSGEEPPSRGHPGAHPEGFIRLGDVPSALFSYEAVRFQELWARSQEQRPICIYIFYYFL